MRARRAYALLAAAVVALDQGTKWLVDRMMSLHESHPVVDGLVSLTYVRNRGAAFGLLSDAELPYQAILFSAVSVLALGAVVVYSFRLPVEARLPQTALALVTGGAVGNLVDRALYGYVIDFVDVFWKNHHWPAFNVADSCISVGVALLLLDSLLSPAPAPSAGSEATGAGVAAAPAGRTE